MVDVYNDDCSSVILDNEWKNNIWMWATEKTYNEGVSDWDFQKELRVEPLLFHFEHNQPRGDPLEQTQNFLKRVYNS